MLELVAIAGPPMAALMRLLQPASLARLGLGPADALLAPAPHLPPYCALVALQPVRSKLPCPGKPLISVQSPTISVLQTSHLPERP